MHFLPLFTIILLEGFVTISVEILAIRQLLPFVGNSVIVTSLIIGCFLLFLALGYRQGGFYFKRFTYILKRNFVIAAALIGIGLAYPFVSVFFAYSYSHISTHILIALSLYLSVVVAPIVYILGQTVPITTNLFKSEKWVGAISGKVLYLSTLGSFLGATVTSLALLNFLGVAWTVLINCLILALLILILFKNTLINWLITLSLIPLLGYVYHINVHYEKKHFIASTLYGNYEIKRAFSLVDLKPITIFMSNKTVSSYLTTDNKAAPYIEAIKQRMFKNLGLRNKAILVVGAGGFSITAQGKFGNDVTYVDIDPKIKMLAEKHFIKKVNGHFVARDARQFLRQHPNSYDAIVVDVFESYISIPQHLVTLESMLTMRAALRENGWVFFNLVANPMFTDKYSQRMRNTILKVFPSCIISTREYQDKLTNILYSCHKQPNDDVTTIYTDNINRSTLDFFKSDIHKLMKYIYR